ncbi:hypothetical protein ABEP50_18840 [Priestia megaterium]
MDKSARNEDRQIIILYVVTCLRFSFSSLEKDRKIQQKKEKEEKRAQIIRQLPLREKDSQHCTMLEKRQILEKYRCLGKERLKIPSFKG